MYNYTYTTTTIFKFDDERSPKPGEQLFYSFKYVQWLNMKPAQIERKCESKVKDKSVRETDLCHT